MSYVILSDIHGHKWSLFSKPTAEGVNGRLQIIIDEIHRAADHAVSIGASHMVIAGDVLHVRGSIDPEVLNPLEDCFYEVLGKGLDIVAIPGNHDLAGKETTAIGNAIRTFGKMQNGGKCFIVDERPTIRWMGDHRIAMFPFRATFTSLLEDMQVIANELKHHVGETDAFIHAGIDGVLPSMPDHGLTPAMLQTFGFRAVFAGDYHNHKDLGGNIYSIGALTHQTWSDLGSRAGFMVVHDDGSIKHMATHAPRFIDVTGMTEEEMAEAARGNYVRFSAKDMTTAEITEIRKFFEDNGSLGTSIIATKKVATARRPGAAKAGSTLDDSVVSFVDGDATIPAFIDRDRLKSACVEVLAKARSVHEEA